ncbi:MAG: hypothetical protein AAGD13_17275 [Pseudomonadota bacterium]
MPEPARDEELLHLFRVLSETVFPFVFLKLREAGRMQRVPQFDVKVWYGVISNQAVCLRGSCEPDFNGFALKPDFNPLEKALATHKPILR